MPEIKYLFFLRYFRACFTLLNDRIDPGFTNNQVGPLRHHYTDHEGCVTRVFQFFTTLIRPFLAVRVLQVVYMLRIPLLTYSYLKNQFLPQSG